MLKILSDEKALSHNFIGSVFCFLILQLTVPSI